jgi:hypothetical protein
MIPYEELCAALDRHAERHGGIPGSPAHAPQPSAPRAPLSMSPSPARSQVARPAAPSYEPPAHDVELPSHHDEPHDPDLGHFQPLGGVEDDATHVGGAPHAAPPPLAPAGEDHSNEIDIGDVLADDEL